MNILAMANASTFIFLGQICLAYNPNELPPKSACLL